MDEGGETVLEWTRGFRVHQELRLSQVSMCDDRVYQEIGTNHLPRGAPVTKVIWIVVGPSMALKHLEIVRGAFANIEWRQGMKG